MDLKSFLVQHVFPFARPKNPIEIHSVFELPFPHLILTYLKINALGLQSHEISLLLLLYLIELNL